MIDIHPLREPGLWLFAVFGVFGIGVVSYNTALVPYETLTAPSEIESAPANISRAQYLSARGSRQSAWGEYSILIVRNDGTHQVIVGMTEPECLALHKQLETEKSARTAEKQAVRWLTSCYKR